MSQHCSNHGLARPSFNLAASSSGQRGPIGKVVDEASWTDRAFLAIRCVTHADASSVCCEVATLQGARARRPPSRQDSRIQACSPNAAQCIRTRQTPPRPSPQSIDRSRTPPPKRVESQWHKRHRCQPLACDQVLRRRVIAILPPFSSSHSRIRVRVLSEQLAHATSRDASREWVRHHHIVVNDWQSRAIARTNVRTPCQVRCVFRDPLLRACSSARLLH